MRRRRSRLISALVMLLIILPALILADRHGLLVYEGDDWLAYHQRSFAVVRVIDGDTLVLAAPDARQGREVTHVRLWGIDTPELARPQEQRPAQPLAEDAARFASELVDGRNVTLRLQKHRIRDKYDRLLAFVVLDDQSVLNERLLAAGLARTDDRWTHEHLHRYEMIQRQAVHDRAGLWRQRVSAGDDR